MSTKIYYHYFCTEISSHIFKKTLEEIITSGLYAQEILACETSKITVNVVGVQAKESIVRLEAEYKQFKKLEFCSYRSTSLKELLSALENNIEPSQVKGALGFEGDTLELLYNDITGDNKQHNVLYLHSKGSVNPGAFGKYKTREDWRKEMSDYVIKNWRSRFLELATKPHTGANPIFTFQENGIPHYSGNFWWTQSTHIKSLLSFYAFCSKQIAKNIWHANLSEERYTSAKGQRFLPFIVSPFYLAEYYIVNGLKDNVKYENK